MKQKVIPISYINEDGERVTDEVRVTRMRSLARAKLFDDVRKDVRADEAPTATALAMLGLTLIANSVIGDDGKPLFTPEQIDEAWDTDKINAYKKAIDEFQKPTVEEAAKKLDSDAERYWLVSVAVDILQCLPSELEGRVDTYDLVEILAYRQLQNPKSQLSQRFRREEAERVGKAFLQLCEEQGLNQ